MPSTPTSSGARWENLLAWLRELGQRELVPALQRTDGRVAHYVERTLHLLDRRGAAGGPLELALAGVFPAIVSKVRGGAAAVNAGILDRHRQPKSRPMRIASFEMHARAKAQLVLETAKQLEADLHDESGRVKPGYLIKDVPPATGPPDHPVDDFPVRPPGVTGDWPCTVEDAIQYVGCRRLRSSNVDYLYLNRVRTFPVDNPYSWVVAAKKDVQPEHLMVSNSCIVHICPGLHTEYHTLEDFVEEKNQFVISRRIRYFREFQLKKAFGGWRRYCRQVKYNRARAKIGQQSFTASPLSSPTLLVVRGLLLELEKLRSIELAQNHRYTRDALAELFQSGTDKVKDAMLTLVNLLDACLVDHKDRAYKYLRGSDEKQRAHMLIPSRKLHTGLERLASFERLIFMMMQQAMLTTGARCYGEDYKGFLANRVSSTCGDFAVELVQTVGGALSEFPLEVSSTGAAMAYVIGEGMSMLTSELCEACERYRTLRQPYLPTGEASANALVGTLQASKRRAEHCMAENFTEMFSSCQIIVANLGWMAEILDFSTGWNDAQLAEYSQSDLSEIHTMLGRLTQWRGQLEAIPRFHYTPGSYLAIDAKLAQISGVGRLRAIERDLQLAICNRLGTGCAAVREDIDDSTASITNMLQLNLTDALQFADFVVKLRRLQHGVGAIAATLVDINTLACELEAIGKEFGQKVDFSLVLSFRADVRGSWNNLNVLLNAAEQLKTEATPMMIDRIWAMLRELEAQTEPIRSEVANDPVFHYPSSDAQLVLDDLHDRAQQLETILSQAQQLRKAIEIISGKKHERCVDYFQNVFKMLRCKQEIWALYYEINAYFNIALQKPAERMDLQHVLNLISHWTTKSQSHDEEDMHNMAIMEDALPHRPAAVKMPEDWLEEKVKDKGGTKFVNEVLAFINRQLNRLRSLCMLVNKLMHPAIRPRHLEALFVGIGRPFAHYCSLRDYASMGIELHSVLVGQLLQNAIVEERQTKQIEDIDAWAAFSQIPFHVQEVPNPTSRRARESARTRWKMVAEYLMNGLRTVKKLRKSTMAHSLTQMLERDALGSDVVELIGDTGQLECELIDHLGTLRALCASEIDDIRITAEGWFVDLSNIVGMIDAWHEFQNLWLLISPLFQRQRLPKLQKLRSVYATLDTTYRAIMSQTYETPKVVSLLGWPVGHRFHRQYQGNCVTNFLRSAAAEMETIFNVVKIEYLDSAREQCPRLHYLSNSEMLEVLEENNTPSEHSPIRRCFMGIERLRCARFVPDEFSNADDAPHSVVGLSGVGGNLLAFSGPVVIDPAAPVGHWEQNTIMRMKLTIARHISEYATLVEDPTVSLVPADYKSYCANTLPQVQLVVQQIWFTAAVNAALGNAAHRSGSLELVRASKLEELTVLANMARNVPTNFATNAATAVHFVRNVENLYVAAVNQIAALDALDEGGNAKFGTFEWESQRRYALQETGLPWDEQDGEDSAPRVCIVTQLGWSQAYENEFDGGTFHPISITPLTHRCLVAMHSALARNQIPALHGPGAVGKTETVVHAARALGKHLLSISCSKATSIEPVASTIIGMAEVGSWLLFECIDKLDSSLLSIIKVKMIETRWATADGIVSSAPFGVLATRSTHRRDKSPVSTVLQGLLRSIHIVEPDIKMILEVRLRARGYYSASGVASKLATLSAMAHEQGIPGYGLRPLLRVVIVAGGLSGSTERQRVAQAIRKTIVDMQGEKNAAASSSILESLDLVALDLGAHSEDPSISKTAQPPVPFSLEGSDSPSGIITPASASALSPVSTLSPNSFSFPSVPVPELTTMVGTLSRDLFVGVLRDVYHEHNLVIRPQVELACAMLNDGLTASKAVALIGAPGCGKTSCFNMLVKALNRCAREGEPRQHIEQSDSGNTLFAMSVRSMRSIQKTAKKFQRRHGSAKKSKDGWDEPEALVSTRIFPSAMPLADLIGELDASTGKWKDGVLTDVLRSAVKASGKADGHQKRFVVLDGKLDSTWTDAAQSVLSTDAPGQLHLPTGECVSSDNVSIVIESDDLALASPGFVDRLIVVHLPSDLVCSEDLAKTWLSNLLAKHPATAPDMFGLMSTVIVNLARPAASSGPGQRFSFVNTPTFMHSLLASYDALLTEFQLSPKPKAPPAVLSGDTVMSILAFGYVQVTVGMTAATWSPVDVDDWLRSRLTVMMPTLYMPAEDHARLAQCMVGKTGRLVLPAKSGLVGVPSMSELWADWFKTSDMLASAMMARTLLASNVPMMVVGSCSSRRVQFVRTVWEDADYGPLSIASIGSNFSGTSLRAAMYSEDMNRKCTYNVQTNFLPRASIGIRHPLTLFVDDLNCSAKQDESHAEELVRELSETGTIATVTGQDRNLGYRSFRNARFVIGSPRDSELPGRVRRHFVQIRTDHHSDESLQQLVDHHLRRATITTLDMEMDLFSDEPRRPSSFGEVIVTLVASLRAMCAGDESLLALFDARCVADYLIRVKLLMDATAVTGNAFSDSSLAPMEILLREEMLANCSGVMRLRGYDGSAFAAEVERLCGELTGVQPAAVAGTGAYDMPLTIVATVGHDSKVFGSEAKFRSFLEGEIDRFHTALPRLSQNMVSLNGDALGRISRVCRALQLPGKHLLVEGPRGISSSLLHFCAFISRVATTEVVLLDTSQIDALRIETDTGKLTIVRCTSSLLPAMVERLQELILRSRHSGLDLDSTRTASTICIMLCDEEGASKHLSLLADMSTRCALLQDAMHVEHWHCWDADEMRHHAQWYLGLAGDGGVALDRTHRHSEAVGVVLQSMHEKVAREKSNITMIITDATYQTLIVNIGEALFRRTRTIEMRKARAVSVEAKIERICNKEREMVGEVNRLREKLTVADAAAVDAFNHATKKRAKLVELVAHKNALSLQSQSLRNELLSLENRLRTEFADTLEQQAAAHRGVKALDKNDLLEISCYRAPPGTVVRVMKALCWLMRHLRAPPVFAAADPRIPALNAEPTWAEAKLLLINNFQDKLDDFHPDYVAMNIFHKVRAIVESEDFDLEFVAFGSIACISIGEWVKAVVRYVAIKLEMAPFARKKEELIERVEALRKQLASVTKREETIREQVRKAKVDLDQVNLKRSELLAEIEGLKAKLNKVRNLLLQTQVVRDRARSRLEGLRKATQTLVGDCVISGGLKTYGSCCTQRARDGLLDLMLELCDANGIPATRRQPLPRELLDGNDAGYWKSLGLPDDNDTLDKAVGVLSCTLLPIVWDPHECVVPWLSCMAADSGSRLKVLSALDKNLMRNILKARAANVPVIVTDFEDEHCMAFYKATIASESAADMFRLHAKHADADAGGFRLYFTRQSPFPVPWVLDELFYPTSFDAPAILRERLLRCARATDELDQEASFLESRAILRTKYAVGKSADANLWVILGHVTTDDLGTFDAADDALDYCRRILSDRQVIEASLSASANAKYEPFAEYGKMIFELIRKWSTNGCWYHDYSLSRFCDAFSTAIRDICDRQGSLERFTETSQRIIHVSLYRYFCCALSQDQQLQFSLELAVEQQRQQDLVSDAERALLDTLLATNTPDELDVDVDGELAPERLHARAELLTSVEGLKDLPASLTANPSMWKEYLGNGSSLLDPSPLCVDRTPASGSGQPRSLFQRLLLLLRLVPSATIPLVREYAGIILGPKLYPLDAATFTEDAMACTTPITPILICDSWNDDWLSRLLVHGSQAYGDGDGVVRLHVVSAAPSALALAGTDLREIVARASADGAWVLIADCQLAEPPFLKLMEIVVSELTGLGASPTFRLWIECPAALSHSLPLVPGAHKIVCSALRDTRGRILSRLDWISASHAIATNTAGHRNSVWDAAAALEASKTEQCSRRSVSTDPSSGSALAKVRALALVVSTVAGALEGPAQNGLANPSAISRSILDSCMGVDSLRGKNVATVGFQRVVLALIETAIPSFPPSAADVAARCMRLVGQSGPINLAAAERIVDELTGDATRFYGLSLSELEAAGRDQVCEFVRLWSMSSTSPARTS